MTNSDKSYLEIKVTFQHILILLAGIIIIGSFLFYLGYQAGQSSDAKNAEKANMLAAEKENRPALPLEEDKEDKKAQPDATDPDKIDSNASSINEEINLHRQPQEQDPPNVPEGATDPENHQPEKKSEPPAAKPIEKTTPPATPTRDVRKETMFAIQVGAFHSYSLAQQYSVKFSRAGYPISISQGVVSGKTWFRVKVGNFKTRVEAKKEKQKLERLENKTFAIVNTD